ncbi:MAG: low molecular weight phosphotyrosine protein phosphatase [Clostridia bacterium]|jgi:protein-tyrosine phosphatase|nr:low molecular weight phosphotyrosine protein phosphatase [Clostridia bacterium]
MISILFLCHGNICRSPMAEFIFKSLIKGNDKYFVQSKAVSSEEIGNPIYPPAQRMLRQKGIPFDDHRASRITKQDYGKFDYIIVMEEYNIPRLMNIIGSDPCNKVYRLLDFTSQSGDIEDPWFTGNYEKVFEQIKEGCNGLLKHLE